MKTVFRKALGIFCILMCVGAILNFMSKMMFNSDRNTLDFITHIILFSFFAFSAWSLLSKPKKIKGENPEEVKKEEEIKVSLGTSILVYLIDAIIVIIVWALPSLFGSLLGANSAVTTILGLLGWLQFILAIVLLPGPKKVQRLMNKRKENKLIQ